MYTVYTTQFDQTLDAYDLMDLIESHASSDIETFKNFVTPRIPKPTSSLIENTNPVTLLVDCSGSLKGKHIQALLPALYAVADILEQNNVPFEILGFTTVEWKGGQSRKQWINNQRKPQNPGRLNDRLHLVFKDIHDNWETVKNSLLSLLLPFMLKENIDGEALEWAHNRIQKNGRIVFISDGAPIDDSTLSTNPVPLLSDHRNEAIAAISRYTKISILNLKKEIVPYDPNMSRQTLDVDPQIIANTLIETINLTT